MLPAPSRTRTLLLAIALAACGVVGVTAGAAGPTAQATAAATPIAATSEASPAFRRAAERSRARTALRPPVGAALHRPTTRAASPAGSTGFAFSTLLDGRPVRWNPCAPITWTAHVSRGPAGGLAVLQRAVTRIAAATGTTWQYVGSSAEVPSTGYLPTGPQQVYRPVLIGWTDGAQSDLLAGQAGNVLGMARTSWFGVQAPDGTRSAATRAGVVALDRTDRLPLTGPGSWEAVALHELGHVMGLDHVGDSSQLMASVLPAVAGLQPGDQAGLRALGRDAGCVVVPQ